MNNYLADKKSKLFSCVKNSSNVKPDKDRVFFNTSKEALLQGFNPSSSNNPMLRDNMPEEVEKAFNLANHLPEKELRNSDLKTLELNITVVDEWFQNHHNMTFQEYYNIVYFNSQFGLADIYGSQKIEDDNFIVINRIINELGVWIVGTTTKGITLLETAERPNINKQLTRLKKHHKKNFIYGSHPLLIQLDSEINEYLKGTRKTFDVPIDIKGTSFQEKVWQVLLAIPYGKTISYKEEAETLGSAKAVRAVANANGINPVSIIVPCHRVIGHNGKLVGYGGKLWRKQHLIDLEKQKCSNK